MKEPNFPLMFAVHYLVVLVFSVMSFIFSVEFLVLSLGDLIGEFAGLCVAFIVGWLLIKPVEYAIHDTILGIWLFSL